MTVLIRGHLIGWRIDQMKNLIIFGLILCELWGAQGQAAGRKMRVQNLQFVGSGRPLEAQISSDLPLHASVKANIQSAAHYYLGTNRFMLSLQLKVFVSASVPQTVNVKLLNDSKAVFYSRRSSDGQPIYGNVKTYLCPGNGTNYTNAQGNFAAPDVSTTPLNGTQLGTLPSHSLSQSATLSAGESRQFDLFFLGVHVGTPLVPQSPPWSPSNWKDFAFDAALVPNSNFDLSTATLMVEPQIEISTVEDYGSVTANYATWWDSAYNQGGTPTYYCNANLDGFTFHNYWGYPLVTAPMINPAPIAEGRPF
jgi:hypothetical protein